MRIDTGSELEHAGVSSRRGKTLSPSEAPDRRSGDGQDRHTLNRAAQRNVVGGCTVRGVKQYQDGSKRGWRGRRVTGKAVPARPAYKSSVNPRFSAADGVA